MLRYAPKRYPMSFPKPADFPYPSRYAEVLGSKLHYVEHGEGDPILFLHGQPTWSYLWRNVMPELEGRGRLIALDLVGYGMSDKPELAYEMSDHIRYVEAFIETLQLERLTLVIHDWGSFFGFHYAMQHPEKIRGIAFMEAILFPVPSYDAFDPELRTFFQTLRESQENAERMMCVENLFLEQVLPGEMKRTLTAAEHDAYRAPWTDAEDRKILCKFPQNLCIGEEPKAIYEMQAEYMAKLQTSPLPKLCAYAEPGLLIPKEMADWCGSHLPNCEVVRVGESSHYIQEDCAPEIGRAIADWMTRALP